MSDNGYLIAVRYPTNPTSTVVGADTRFPLDRSMHGIVFMKRCDRVPDDQRCVMVGAARGPTRFVEVDGLQSPLPTKR